MRNNQEGAVIARVQIDSSAKGWRLFRNSVGMAWQGNKVGEFIKDGVRIVMLKMARRIKYGLGVGTSDLVGWQPVVITQEMVGQTIAQFTVVECKTQGYKRTTEEQDNFLEQVAMAGGAAYIARGKGETVDMIAVEAD